VKLLLYFALLLSNFLRCHYNPDEPQP
jgi:hypothetical protein